MTSIDCAGRTECNNILKKIDKMFLNHLLIVKTIYLYRMTSIDCAGRTECAQLKENLPVWVQQAVVQVINK